MSALVRITVGVQVENIDAHISGLRINGVAGVNIDLSPVHVI